MPGAARAFDRLKAPANKQGQEQRRKEPHSALDPWETEPCKTTGAKGVHDLYLKFFGNGPPMLNLDR
jgi:hypothetical protein